MTPSVSSHGYGDASIYFLGGFPLGADTATGLALSGHSESTLNTFLRPHRLTAKQTYRALYIREKLSYSGNSVKRLKKAVEEIDREGYEQMLRDELKEVRPNVIVPLDDIALGVVYPQILTQKKPRGRRHWIYCYRGSVLNLREDWQADHTIPIKVIPTLAPQLLYNDSTARAYVAIDFERIAKYRNFAGKAPEYGNRWVAKTADAFHTYVRRSFEKQPKFCVFDIETYGGFMTCISFSFDGYEGVSVPLSDNKLPKAERAIMWQLVSKLLAHPIPKVNQNIKYDLYILRRHGFVINNIAGDTMLAGSLLYPELAKGLDFYTSIYTEIPYYKDEGKEFDPKTQTRDRLYLYNAMDSIATHAIHTAQEKDLEELGLTDLYKKEVVPLIMIYTKIDETGIRIDQERKEALLAKYKGMYENALSILRTLVGELKFNPRSSQQVGKFIYEELKFPMRKKTDPETGRMAYKTDKETLDDLLINHADRNKQGQIGCAILARIIAVRKLAKVIEYIETPLHPDNRLRGAYNLAGPNTGRSSCNKTLDEYIVEDGKSFKMKRLGRSLQTISKHGFQLDEEIFDDFQDCLIAGDLRSMFVPSPGFVFVEMDGSQAEARAVAVLAEDWELLDSFDKKPKIHAKTAAMVFDIDVNTITKDFPRIPKIGIAYYDLGKRIRHAGNYDMGPGRLAQMSHLPFGECSKMLNKFHDGNPKIRAVFHEEISRALRGERVLRTPFSRRRDFFGAYCADMLKQGIAYIPQSSISDQTKFTMPRIIDDPDASFEIRFLAEMHDGILAEVRKGNEMPYAKIAKKHYERPISFRECTLSRDFDLHIPAEISIGADSWMDLEEVKV